MGEEEKREPQKPKKTRQFKEEFIEQEEQATERDELLIADEHTLSKAPSEKLSFLDKLLGEQKKPALVIFRDGLLIIFGVGILSLVGWIIEIGRISDTAKEIFHAIHEYLMIFAFVILGISFIIEIVTVVLGGHKKDE